MKTFINPEIEIEKFMIEDVITTSPNDDFIPGDNETPLS